MTSDPNDFDPQTFFVESKEPDNWLKMAVALHHTASNLWTKRHDFGNWRYLPIYRMLIAFSIENLLKGIVIVEGYGAIEDNELSKRLRHHNLQQFADSVSGVTITRPEKCLLGELKEYLMWVGRYPMPTKPAFAIQIRYSKAQHDAELALAQRLANYLAQKCTDVDPREVALGVENTGENDLQQEAPAAFNGISEHRHKT